MAGDVSRINGAKGGRPKGSRSTSRQALGAAEYDVRKKARLSLQERCQQNELKYVDELERIAKSSPNDSSRIAAISLLLDRARGKAGQPLTGPGGNSPIQLIVQTGVPEPEETWRDGPVLSMSLSGI
jgi:hypothetical protein